MVKQGRYLLLIILLVGCLSGCLGTIWTGASLVYDRHNVYKKLNDYHLLAEVSNALYIDKAFKCEGCVIDVVAFNGDVLLAGHLPSQELLDELKRRLTAVEGFRRLYNEIIVRQIPSNTVQDSWITAKIRSQIFADDSIDPKAFKVVTTDRVVYLMGDVRKDQAEKVIKIARFTSGVERVVKILKYFTYQTK